MVIEVEPFPVMRYLLAEALIEEIIWVSVPKYIYKKYCSSRDDPRIPLALLGMGKSAPEHVSKSNNSYLLLLRFLKAFIAQHIITESITSL